MASVEERVSSLEKLVASLVASKQPSVRGLPLSIESQQMQTNSVRARHLQDDAVGAAAIADSAVTTAAIADDAVTTVKILDAAVTEAKLHADVVAQLGGGGGSEAVAVMSGSYVSAYNTVTETDLVSYTITANLLGNNDSIRITAQGLAVNNTGSDRTYTLKFYFDGSSEFSIDLVIPTSATARAWECQVLLTCRNSATTKTLASRGNIRNGGQNAASSTVQVFSGLNTTTSGDNSSSRIIKMTVTNSTASTSMSFEVNQYIVEHVVGP